jgi:hypothetical protein
MRRRQCADPDGGSMRRRQYADPDGGRTLFSLWNCMEVLSEIVHRGRKHHLIIRTAGQLKDWYSDKVTMIWGSTVMICPSTVD